MIGKVLCFFGFHKWHYGWVSDNKGNAGDFCQCSRCGKFHYDYESYL